MFLVVSMVIFSCNEQNKRFASMCFRGFFGMQTTTLLVVMNVEDRLMSWQTLASAVAMTWMIDSLGKRCSSAACGSERLAWWAAGRKTGSARAAYPVIWHIPVHLANIRSLERIHVSVLQHVHLSTVKTRPSLFITMSKLNLLSRGKFCTSIDRQTH